MSKHSVWATGSEANCYLTELKEKGFTEEMINTAAFSLGKLYGCRKKDFDTLPPRL